MRIEEGKFYRTRGGRKVGPVRATGNIFWPMKCEGTWWRENGESCEGSMTRMYPQNDIISEWAEASPIVTETVTVRRMEPGVYGRLGVGEIYGANSVWVEIKKDRNGSLGLNAHELRELARVALDVAEYLDGLD